MEDATYLGFLVAIVVRTAIIAGAPLIAATLVGLLISIFQAITQIQDQTLSQTVKIFTISAVLLSFGAALFSPLLAISTEIFDSIALVGR